MQKGMHAKGYACKMGMQERVCRVEDMQANQRVCSQEDVQTKGLGSQQGMLAGGCAECWQGAM